MTECGTQTEALTRNELAALALTSGRRQLLVCDGGVGALDLWADTESGVRSLQTRGLIAKGGKELRGTLLEGVKIIDAHDAEVMAIRADGVRRSSIAFLSATGASLVIAPKGQGPAANFAFVVTDRAGAVRMVRESLLLRRTATTTVLRSPFSVRLRRVVLDDVKTVAQRRDREGVKQLLVRAIGDAGVADRLSRLVNGRPIALEFMVARRGVVGPMLQRLCWNMLPDEEVVEYVVDIAAGELLLTSSDAAHICDEVDAMVKEIA